MLNLRPRDYILLSILSLYLLLNYGFMQIRILVPTGELLLACYLVSINWLVLLPRFNKFFYAAPFLIFWSFGIIRACLGAGKYGLWSFRDASKCYESLYILIGFLFAFTPKRTDTAFRWWFAILGLCSLYGLLFPWRPALSAASPHLSGGAGGSVAVLFNFEGTLILMLTFAVALIIHGSRDFVRRYLEIAVGIGLIAFALGIYQSRTSYIIFAIITLYLIAVAPRHFGKWSLLILVLAGSLFIISVTGIQIKGRLHQNISFDFLEKHVAAIGGKEDEGVTGAAEGSQERIGWWIRIYEEWTSSPTHFLFGLGYGFPLTDLVTSQGVQVREPHNSLMSVIGRLGLIGAASWLWIQALLLRTWFRALRNAHRWGSRTDVWRMKWIMVYFIAVWITSMTEPAFELSFVCIPFYFMWGVLIRYSAFLRDCADAPPEEETIPEAEEQLELQPAV
jgi:hypothetical protein